METIKFEVVTNPVERYEQISDVQWSPTSSSSAAEDPMRAALTPFFESPIISAVRVAIFVALNSPLGAACVRGCSENLKASMISVVGKSADTDAQLLAPFHSVIQKSRTNLVAQRKIAWVCHSMRKFEICLRPCGDTKAKRLRLTTTDQWKSICEESRKFPKSFGEFVGCERRHHERALRKCPNLHISNDISLDSFCRTLNDYTECYAKVPFQCLSKNATKIWDRVNTVIQRTFERILELSSGDLRLPPECEWSMRNSALRHSESEYSDDDEENEEKTTKSTTLKTTTMSTTTYFNEFVVDYWMDVDEEIPTTVEVPILRYFSAEPTASPIEALNFASFHFSFFWILFFLPNIFFFR